MAIVGISGSPIVKSNTDRMIESLLEHSGKDSKFIKLSKLQFGSCRGCGHNCATTAMCGVVDGLHPYFTEIRDAEALIIGSPNHHGTMTGWTFSFFSRLWCFLHENKTLKNKPVIFVSTGIDPVPENGPETFNAGFVKEHDFNVLGSIYYRSLVPPCFTCGKGSACQWGGLWRMVGRDVDALNDFEIKPEKFRRWEDDKLLVEEVARYGTMLREI